MFVFLNPVIDQSPYVQMLLQKDDTDFCPILRFGLKKKKKKNLLLNKRQPLIIKQHEEAKLN